MSITNANKQLSNSDGPSDLSSLFYNLDFVRSFAVMLVVVRHLLPVFGIKTYWFFQPQALGIFGVLIFFVHTSLVLMFSLERQTGRAGMQHFYAIFIIRRCFRIYPLTITVIFSCLAISWYCHINHFSTLSLTPNISVLGVASNLFLVQNLTGTASIIGPLWSLPLEMQMYFFVPFLFLIANRYSLKILIGLWLFTVMLALIQYKITSLPDLIKYIPCFLPGAICYEVSRCRAKLPFWMLPMTLTTLLLVYMIVYGKIRAQIFVGMPLCLILGLLLPRFEALSSPVFRRTFSTIAKYSFGVYLTHVISIWFAFNMLHDVPTSIRWCLFALILCAAPFVLYHAIEAPMINLGNRLVKSVFHTSATNFEGAVEKRVSVP